LTAAVGTGALALAGCVGDGGGDGTDETAADDGGNGDSSPTVSIAQPSDGATINPPVTVSAEIDNFDLVSADTEPREAAGHAHVLIDQGPYEVDEQMPSEDGHVHLNEGDRMVTLEADQLDSGEQRLTTQLANSTHIAIDASDTITVTADLEDGDEPGGGGYGGDRYDA
jgi:hypothetical protein